MPRTRPTERFTVIHRVRSYVEAVADVGAVVTRNRALRRVQLAFAFFKAAETATWIAMLVYAYREGGATESGVLAAAVLVPAALLAPVAATVAGRYQPGTALVVGYAVLASACLAVATAMQASSTRLLVYVLLATVAVSLTLIRPSQAVFAPAFARTPDELTATNVVNGWIESLAALVAPLIAGVLLAVFAPTAIFVVMGIGCAVGALLVAPLRGAVAAMPPEDDAGVREASRLLRRDRNARLLVVLLGAQFVVIGALDVLYVELGQEVLGLPASWVGYLAAAFGAGGVVAAVVTAALVGRRRLALPLGVALILWTAALLMLSVVAGTAAALVLLVVAGGARALFDVTGRTLLQRVAPVNLHGRVFGLLEGLAMAGLAAGSLLAPLLISIGGASLAFVGVAAVLPLATLVAGRRFLEIDRHATVPVVEIALLRSLSLFAPLPPPTIESLAGALQPLRVPAGTDVIVQGEAGETFYVIADGSVDVIRDGTEVAELTRGDGFGELALLHDRPRNATVRTRVDCLLYTLTAEVFVPALTGNARPVQVDDELHGFELGTATSPA